MLDGFVVAVPTRIKRYKLRQHGLRTVGFVKNHGAFDWVECWGDDVA